MAAHGDSGSGAYGDGLAGRFWLKQQQSHVTRTLRRGPLAVTNLKSDFPTPRPSRSIGHDEAWLVALQLRDVTDHELWQDGRPLAVEAFAARSTTFYDLRRDPIAFVRHRYHSLQFYLPRAALAEIASQNGVRFRGELNCAYGVSEADPVIRALGEALLPALARGGAMDGLFLDHVLQAVALHAVARYGDCGPRNARGGGGLAPWQESRAKEMMRARLGGDIPLEELAGACGLSVSQFARAFRQSVGIPPHRWLRARRMEKAMSLLTQTHRPLSDIAIACGFADQSHFTRSFTDQVGLSPGQWRRARRS